MDLSSLTSAKIRTTARLLMAMDEQRETAGLVAARRILDDQMRIIDQAITEIESLKKETTSMETTNEQLSKHFTDGADYLRAWNADRNLRQEFGDDFQSYCFFKQAESLGLVKILQGQTKI